MFVSKRYIKYFFLLAPFLLSSVVYTQTNALYANIILVFKMIAFLYIAADYLINNKISKLDIALVLYLAIWIFSVFLNSGNYIEYAKEVVVILSFVFLIEETFKRGDGYHFILAFEHLIFLEMLINLICLIVFPEGLWKTTSIYGDEAIYTFLGLKNQTTPIFIVAELIIFIRLYFDKFKVSFLSISYFVILIGNLLLIKSVTGIIGCIIVPLILFLGVRYKKLINTKTILLMVVTVFVMIVFLRLQNVFSFIIEEVFDKDLTLTNRITIWDRAIEMIKKKPLFGYGCGTLSTIVVDRNAHDFYLQIMLQTGLIGFLVYINIFRVALKDCLRENKTTICSLIISAVLCGYMVCGISEVYTQSWLFIILSLGYSVKLLSMRGGGGKTSNRKNL